MVSPDLHGAIRKKALASLWRRREAWPLLEVYLDRDQLADIRAFMQGGDAERGVLPSADWYDDISRQRGKSWKWTVFAVVWCHCFPGQQVKYLAQYGTSVRGIIAPTISMLIEDMPREFQPKAQTEESVKEDKVDTKWRFPHNGGESVLHATGANNQHYKALRGPRAHLLIQDECGFYDDFDEVQSALRPMLITTGGCSVYATTPAESPAHPSERTCQALKAAGRHVHRTIHNHPRLSAEEIDERLLSEALLKGMTLEQFKRTTYYRREYLCMHIVESSRAVTPEWTEPANPLEPDGTTWGDDHLLEIPRPLFFDAYDGLDIGFTRDPSAWVGGYWDWSSARLVIEAETPPLYRTRADALAAAILEQRRLLWPCPGPRPSREAKKSPCGTYWLPWASVGDGSGNGAEKLVELQGEGLHFQHAEKPDLESRVNELRTLIAAGKLWVHPRCKNLREQLATGLWADKHAKNDFERTEKGHLDHLAALVDLVHAIDRNRRPVPNDWGVDMHNTAHDGTRTMSYTSAAELNNALGSVEWE